MVCQMEIQSIGHRISMLTIQQTHTEFAFGTGTRDPNMIKTWPVCDLIEQSRKHRPTNGKDTGC